MPQISRYIISNISLIFVISLSIIVSQISPINCLNIDTLFPVEISPRDFEGSSSFGYSVLMFKNNEETQFFIGAPKDRENGAIFKCSLGSPGARKIDCFRQNFTALNIDNSVKIPTNFGANLFQIPPFEPYNNRFLTCAYSQPLFCNEDLKDSFDLPKCHFDRSYVGGQFTKALPVGVCYLFDNENKIRNSVRPFTTWEHQYVGRENYLSHAFLGFSSAISGTGKELFLGIPGINEFIGGAYRYPVPVRSKVSAIESLPDVEYLPRSYNNTELQEHLFGMETRRMWASPERKLRMADQYAGYSMGVAEFWKNSQRQCLLLGVPRKDLAGAVDVYDFDKGRKNIRQVLTGSQSGEYFGASILVLDVNGDGSDDLIVGSPNFWNGSRGFEDQGKATVFLWDKNSEQLTNQVSLFGLGATKGRFGTAIASLGDINLDGYNDIVIGAPYEDDNSGAIYIYHGSISGLKPNHSQRISASDISSPTSSPSGFGFSFSSLLDVDNNGFGDLLVGAYLSNTAVLLRTKPIMSLEPEIEFSGPMIKFTTLCSLTDRNSAQRNKKACMELRFCVDCKIPLLKEPIKMSAIFEADVQKTGDRRVYFTNNDNETSYQFTQQFTLEKSEKKCFDWIKFFVKDKEEIDNFTKPINFQLKFEIADSYARILENRWLNEPVFEVKNPEKSKRGIEIELCKGRAVDCLSNIRLEHSLSLDRKPVSNNRRVDILQGSSSNLTLSLTVTNTGEEAISPKVTIRLNSTRFAVLKQDYRCQEAEIDKDNNQTAFITCDLDNLLIGSNSLELVFSPFNETISMDIGVGIENRLKDGSRTEAKILFLPKRESNIAFLSAHRKTVGFYPHQDKIPFNHTLRFEQKGKSSLQRTEFTLTYPYAYKGYRLVDPPTITKTWQGDPDFRCETQKATNPNERLTVKKGKNKRLELVPITCDTPEVTCSMERCIIERMNGSSAIYIDVKSIMYTGVLEINGNQTAAYQMKLSALVQDTGNDFTAESNFRAGMTLEFFFESHLSEKDSGQKKTWSVIVGILIGLSLLTFVIAILIRCGFFKRNRPPKPSETANLSNTDDSAQESLLS